MGLWDALKQYVRDASPGGALNPEVTPQGALDAAALSTMAVPVVGDVTGLAADAYRMYNDPSERTAGNVGLAIIGGLPLVPNAGALKARAVGMFNQKASPGRIAQETGLVPVPTKEGMQWGVNISDAAARVNPDVLAKVQTALTKSIDSSKMSPVEQIPLSSLLEHPELFKRYPELADYVVEKVNGFQSLAGVQGYFDKTTKTVGIQGLNPYMNSPEQISKQLKDLTSTLLHEAQHAIQEIEKWPRGGNTAEFALASTKRAEESLTAAQKVFKSELKAAGVSDRYTPDYILARAAEVDKDGPKALRYYGEDMLKDVEALRRLPNYNELKSTNTRLERLASKISDRKNKAFGQYQRLAGEAQSRAVQAQFEKGLRLPEYDVGFNELIYRDPFK